MKKAKAAVVLAGALLLAISGSGAFADPRGKEEREARKAQMQYERERRKRDREWEREERKHLKKMAREERKHQEEMWREGGYRLEEPAYGYGVDETYGPGYPEDKAYRILKNVRDLAEALMQ